MSNRHYVNRGNRRPGGTNNATFYCHCGRMAWCAFTYHQDTCHVCGCKGNVSKRKPETPPDKKYWACPGEPTPPAA